MDLVGVSETEKRYWSISKEVKKLQKEDHRKKQLSILEGELDQLVQNNHPLLAYYKELLDQHRKEEINVANQSCETSKEEAAKAFDKMCEYIDNDFLKVSESVFGTFMEVLNERKKVLDRDKEHGSITSFNRKDQFKNAKDTSLPYTKMLFNPEESPEETLEKLIANKKKPLGRPGEKLKQSEIDQDINLIRAYVQYRPEKSKRTHKRQRREVRVERDEIYSDEDLPRNEEVTRTNRPRRRARRQEVKEVYSDEFSDE